jgi:hypothetical protein
MIPESGNRFPEKIMVKQKIEPLPDSIGMKQALGGGNKKGAPWRSFFFKNQ